MGEYRRAAAAAAADQPLVGEPPVRLDDDSAGDREIGGKDAGRGQTAARGEPPVVDGAAQRGHQPVGETAGGRVGRVEQQEVRANRDLVHLRSLPLVLFVGPFSREHGMVSSTLRAGISGALGMTFVGGSVAVSGVLADAPLNTAQALRYAIACALLVAWVRVTGRRLHRPRGTEWLWLIGVAVTGLVVFNYALVYGSRHAEPAVLAVAVACVPVALAAIGPLLEGRSPRARVLAAAVVVSAGAIVVEGLGRSDAIGLLWALTVFVCEAGFTLLALPLLGRHGPEGVSVHTTWIAASMFAVLALSTEGWRAAAAFDVGDLLAIGYLAVGVTAVAFILWYSCVHWLGAGRAGLLTGIAPIAAAAIGVPLTGAPGPAVWAGIALIAAGLVLGLGAKSAESEDVQDNLADSRA